MLLAFRILHHSSSQAHFDAHPYRTEGPEGVWEFARGCMRTYLMLTERAARFDADAEVQAALEAAMVPGLEVSTAVGDGSPGAIRAHVAGLDERVLAARHYGHERLDQLTVEHLLGVR
jgi:xylose isomerase